jgi:sec-independent protein translocase protein TatB
MPGDKAAASFAGVIAWSASTRCRYHEPCYVAAVFGLGFGEFLVLLLVAMIVLGPRELPRYLRKAGQFAGQMRRMAYEMRQKSGIDDVIRSEGLDRDLAEIRRLTRGELTGLNTVMREAANFNVPARAVPPLPEPPLANATNGSAQAAAPATAASPGWIAEPVQAPVPFRPSRIVVERMHEYPSEGPDSYGALPDTAAVYDGGLAPSPLAEDPLYARGEDAPREDAQLATGEHRS